MMLRPSCAELIQHYVLPPTECSAVDTLVDDAHTQGRCWNARHIAFATVTLLMWDARCATSPNWSDIVADHVSTLLAVNYDDRDRRTSYWSLLDAWYHALRQLRGIRVATTELAPHAQQQYGSYSDVTQIEAFSAAALKIFSDIEQLSRKLASSKLPRTDTATKSSTTLQNHRTSSFTRSIV